MEDCGCQNTNYSVEWDSGLAKTPYTWLYLGPR